MLGQRKQATATNARRWPLLKPSHLRLLPRNLQFRSHLRPKIMSGSSLRKLAINAANDDDAIPTALERSLPWQLSLSAA
jgi:hypothetical protein